MAAPGLAAGATPACPQGHRLPEHGKLRPSARGHGERVAEPGRRRDLGGCGEGAENALRRRKGSGT